VLLFSSGESGSEKQNLRRVRTVFLLSFLVGKIESLAPLLYYHGVVGYAASIYDYRTQRTLLDLPPTYSFRPSESQKAGLMGNR